MGDHFRRVASRTAELTGSPVSFLCAVGVIVSWALLGPLFGFSDTWQLVINTGTTIVTFLMVFLLQSTQNRDTRAIHLKLDELIRAQKSARNFFADVESASEAELRLLQEEFRNLRQQGLSHHDAAERAHHKLHGDHDHHGGHDHHGVHDHR